MSLDLFKPNEVIRMCEDEEDDLNDAWDDTELVKAYNATIKGFRKEKNKSKMLNPESASASVPGPWVSVNDGDYSFGFTGDELVQDQIVNGDEEINLEEQQGSSGNGTIKNKNTDNKAGIAVSVNDSTLNMTPLLESIKNYDEEDQERLYLLTWAVGSHCRTIYSEDDVEYEAKIIEIVEDLSFCTVRFVGYGNQEVVAMKSLKSSRGKQTRDKQRREALKIFQESNNQEQKLLSKKKETHVYYTSFNAYEDDSNQNLADNTPITRRQRGRNKVSRPKYNESGLPRSQNKSSFQVYNEESSEDEEQDDSNEPRDATIQQDWLKAFPNLFMPPMPTSSSATGMTNFGKGNIPSLLMAWYMSGYHSGYFDAKQDMRIKKQKLLQQQQLEQLQKRKPGKS